MMSFDMNGGETTDSSYHYNLVEIVGHLRDLLLPPDFNLLGFSLELLDYSNVLRWYLVGVCEQILREEEIDSELRSTITKIITTHTNLKSEAKYNIVVKAMKMLHIHETNLTELTPKRPETVKLRDKYFPDTDHNAPERKEIYYYAIKAKKLVNGCNKDNVADDDIKQRLYNDTELNTKKKEILDIVLLFVQKHLDKCEEDWVYVTSRFNLIQRVAKKEEEVEGDVEDAEMETDTYFDT